MGKVEMYYDRNMSDDDSNSTNPDIRLREVVNDDIFTLYQHQLDPDANLMAGVHPRDAQAFGSHWERILNNPNVVAKAIIADGALVGSISCFKMDGQDAVGYWIAKEHWGRGIATRALALLLEEVTTRPLCARVATHNIGSIRVLERCGFAITGYEHSPETERYVACKEVIMIIH